MRDERGRRMCVRCRKALAPDVIKTERGHCIALICGEHGTYTRITGFLPESIARAMFADLEEGEALSAVEAGL